MEIQTGRRAMIGTLAGTLVALPAGLFLISCGSETPNGDNPAAPPEKKGTQIVYTSNIVDEHSHTFGLDMSALVMPPAAGVSGSTSSDSGHTHALSISAEQLQSVSSGQSVKVTVQSASGHTHVLTLVNVS